MLGKNFTEDLMHEQQQFLATVLKHKTLKHSQSLGQSELSHGASKFILKKKVRTVGSKA